MKKAKEIAGRKCPTCGKAENQVSAGKNRSGTQRCFCKECKKYYTLDPKTREYPEEIRQQAIKTFYAGASGRGVGKVFGFSKANVYNWIKKTTPNQNSGFRIDELSIQVQHILMKKFINDFGRRTESQALTRAIINESDNFSNFLIRNISKGRTFREKLTK